MKKFAKRSIIILTAIVMAFLLSSASAFATASGTGDATLDNLLATGGFEYDSNKDIFQSIMYPAQRNFGYCGAYDLALTAIGKDPANVANYNLLKALGDYNKVNAQG